MQPHSSMPNRSGELFGALRPVIFVVLSAIFIFVVMSNVYQGSTWVLLVLLLLLIAYPVIKGLRLANEIVADSRLQPGEKIVFTSTFNFRFRALAVLLVSLILLPLAIANRDDYVFVIVALFFFITSAYKAIKSFRDAAEVYVDVSGIGMQRHHYAWSDLTSVLFMGGTYAHYRVLTKQGKVLEINGQSRKFDMLLSKHLMLARPSQIANQVRWLSPDRQEYVPVDHADAINIELHKPLPKYITIPFAVIIFIMVIIVCVWILTHYVDW
jgi:hypothetical protein